MSLVLLMISLILAAIIVFRLTYLWLFANSGLMIYNEFDERLILIKILQQLSTSKKRILRPLNTWWIGL